MTRTLPILLAATLTALLSGAPALQVRSEEAEPTLISLHLACSDFTHNNDGSWSPVRAISFNGVIMSPDISYKTGQRVGGIPIVELLNNECVTH